MNVQEVHGSHNSQDYFLHRRNIKELLHLKGDDTGYVQGKVFMMWPPRSGLHRINLEVAEGSSLYRFEVEVPHKDGMTFRPHEHISLALKGMRVGRRKESSSPHYFPIVLRFPDGVVLKYLSGAHAGRVVDTWEGNSDEWYNPGGTVSNAVTLDTSETNRDAISEVTRRQSNAKRAGCTSKRARKKRRLHKEKELTHSNELADDTNRPRSVDAATPFHEQAQSAIHNSLAHVSINHSTPHQVSGHANVAASTREVDGVGLLRENSNSIAMTVQGTSLSALQLKAGVRTQRGDIFTALNDLQKGHSMINIIGIVTSVFPDKQTKTKEWGRSFTLTDPSTVNSPRAIRVNCFQKKYLEWLPQVQKDDIVILRKLKIVEFNGAVAATGYGDKLRWAVYDPLGRTIRPPDKGDAPERELIDDGMGYEFCPYWDPFQDSIELEYCQQVGEWWKAKRELEGQNISAVACSAPLAKRHRLISEASPDLPPNGFFNCTVEVLQKFNNHDYPTDIYVTDYTVSPLVHSVQATWCPPELFDCVLKCTMWDNAGNIAKMMNPGEYWYLHNVRVRWNPNHHMEGTMQLAEKVAQLDETQLDMDPYLRALLARKKEFKSTKSSSPSLPVFPEMLLQDVDGGTSFLTCIVELLHIDLNLRDGHFIYVTDYTYNPDLPTAISTADWAHNLEHRVVKIKLDDTQAQTASNLEPGSMYTIRNLRVKRLDASNSMHGCLGGEHTLIVALLDLSNCHAQTLQRNKEKWRRENIWNVLTELPDESNEVAHGLPWQSLTNAGNTTLQEILAKPAPNVFRVLARTMDFFPFSLEDACVLRCTKCDSSPPLSFKRCPRCDDMIETHSKWFYCLYILLQDDKGSELIVSLSGKECMLLQGVDPADFRCDREAFHKFLAKLDPILGNLRDVHVAWSRNEHKVVESPPMIFTLESWNIGNEKGYSLLDCHPS